MLQSMRDKAKSWVTVVVVAIIAFMMAITGLETLAPNPNNPTVASVNGQDITRAQLAQALEQQRRMLIQQMGDQFDPSMIDEGIFKNAVLQSLIDRSLQLQDAEKQGMDIGQDALDRMIVSMPEFQQDGRFDQARFQMLVRNFGMTPLQFKQMLKEENLLIQLRSGFSASEFVTDAEMQKLSALENQTRDIAWLTLPAAPVRDAVVPSEEEIKAYYENNKENYMTPEEVVVNYIELSRADLAKSVAIDGDDIAVEYQQRIDSLKEDKGERQQVASILIATGEKRTPAEAEKRAKDIRRQLEQGKDFAAIAKKYSDDAVTASKGGDMGIVESGFFGDAFDDAVAELKVGDVSQPVETDYGMQILKLIAREEAKLPTLEQLRDDIVDSLKTRAVEDLFLDKSRQLADISFEAADLVQPAEQFGLEIKSSEAFGRDGGLGIASNPKVVKAAFSDDVLNLGANSEIIELSPESVAVIRVKEHHKPELIALDDVKGGITTALKKQTAYEQLQEKTGKLIAAIKSGDAEKVAKDENLQWQESKGVSRGQTGIPRQLLNKAFKMPHPGSDSVVLDSAELPNGDMAIISLSRVYAGAYTSEEREKMKGLLQYIAGSNGRNTYGEYLQSLKNSGDVQIKTNDE
ncbi:SurA N-terminal domain-containing protein [Endozoicomonas sp. Mp262]|uniref:SurA N-terminal domain-containing protein n=1 Tax=Endozoicomonas sp. Mp262 TaxID=2919499 RepID=UPI0021DB0DBF